MWPDADERPDVEGHPQHSSSQKSPQEMDVKGEMAKIGEIAIAWIISPVIVFLNPTRNFLNAVLHCFHKAPGVAKQDLLRQCA